KDDKKGDDGDKSDKKESEEPKPEKNLDPEIMPGPLGEGELPSYFHVGLCAKECLLQGFKLGVWQLICNTTTTKDYTLSTFGEAYPNIRDIFGGVELYKEIGRFNFSQSWLTSREFVTELGCRVGTGYGTLVGTIGTKDEFSFKSKLKCGVELLNMIKAELVVPIYREPRFMGYITATPVQNCIVGYRTVYSLEEKGFEMHAFCLGYYNGRTEVGLKLENFQNLRGSFFQRIGEHWAVALKANLYSSENVKQLSVGGQYDFLNGTLVKVRVRDDSRIGFVYQAKVGENLDAMYHLGFDLSDPKGGTHRIGASLEFHC
ncbi:hypothetical protein KR054_012456, partial [Drosophila jambulina]